MAALVVGLFSAALVVGPAQAYGETCESGHPQHCWSYVAEDTYSNYTAVKEWRYVQNVTNPADWMFDTMWFNFASGWVELGTAYGNNKQSDYVYLCTGTPVSCAYIQWADTSPGGPHKYKIVGDGTTFSEWIDGNEFWIEDSEGHVTSGSLTTGLETYQNTQLMPAHAWYNLQYIRGSGSFTDWSGEDHQNTPPAWMCGQWHSPTSFWAGQLADSCS